MEKGLGRGQVALSKGEVMSLTCRQTQNLSPETILHLGVFAHVHSTNGRSGHQGSGSFTLGKYRKSFF